MNTPSSDIQKLRSTVQFMDCLSQGGFTEIAAIAKLCIRSLETPDGHRHLENVVYALRAIWGKADDIQNCINCEAEQVGCNYVNDSMDQFCGARRRFNEEQKQGGQA